ncbi:DNA polymerase III subunit delta [Butyrivibrio sp. INlla16]|uniref:DNA polymerase III subunit delta n=1 Tax=Butyrivibrio sp. INlla16 TaxID=1520807 RepID=UPI0008918190|nr:DNA polymerase III subunit delta [Butyrivibrio sp. INlla16]SDB62362.1 DNA polymerase III, delta subunit [Butyrivibrio sp. INlla16]
MAAKKTTDYPVKQKQINEDIQTGKFRPCYLVYGEEAYLRNQNRDKLREALLGGGDKMNLQHYEGAGINPAEVIDMAETLPFFAERRVIVIEDSGFFKNGCPELADYLKNPAETTVFLFVESAVDKRKDMYKAVSKAGLDIDCETPDEQMLYRWITGKMKAEGKTISARAIAYFISRVGTDMSNMVHEMEKLISYTLGRNEVTEKDIDAVCANWLTSRIFEMTDAIVMKNQAKAMNIYYELLALKTAPEQILALIMRQFNQLLQVKEMTEYSANKGDIAKKLGIHPFVAEKLMGWSRSYQMKDLKDSLDMCLSSDEAVKSGKLDRIISVEMIIVKASSR